MLKMPISSRWRSISVVLPLLFTPAALAAVPALARAPETAAVLETIESGTVSRSAVEALLTRAIAGDPEAAEVAGRLYDRGIGVKWDPPSAIRWYAAAAIAGSDTAKREASRLWRVMPPVSQRRAEAVLARFFTDAELSGINLGPVRRPTTQRSWMANLEAAGFLAPPAPTTAPMPVPAPAAAPAAAAVPAVAIVPPPAAVAKPLSPQLMSVVAAPPALSQVLKAPAAASPAAPAAPAAVAASGTVAPTPPHKPRRKDAVIAPTVVPVAHTPVPPVKPKR
jgi:TPR repeat protein